MNATDIADRRHRIEQRHTEIHVDLAAIRETLANAHTHRAAMSKHLTNASGTLGEARAILDRIKQRMADEEGEL